MATKDNKSIENKIEQMEIEISILRDGYFQLEKTERNLRKSEEKYKDLFYNAPVGFHSFGPNKKIIDINKAELDLLGYTKEEIIDKKTWSDLVSPEDKEKFEKHWNSIIKGEKIKDLEYIIVRKDGEKRNVILNASPKFDDEKNLISTRGAVLDVTLERAAEKKVRELNDLREKFVTIFSHQSRTPVTEIKWVAESLAKDKTKNLDEKQKESIELIKISAKKTLNLIDQLLNVTSLESKSDVLAIEEFSLEKLIAESIKEAKVLVEKKTCDIVFSPEEDNLNNISTDKSLLSQVFENIISNAMVYSNEDCKINIEVHEVDDKYEVSIEDNGIGIPEKDHEHVFEKFYRSEEAAKRVIDKSGLGLYTSKIIMDMLKGDIRFESAENKGSTFFISFPKKLVQEDIHDVEVDDKAVNKVDQPQ